MKEFMCTVISNVEILPHVNLMWLEASQIAATAQPGQFVTLCCGDLTLRRPLSIHQVNKRQIALLFKIAGKGTLWLSQRREGDRLNVLGPLGKGFKVESDSRNLLMLAGGIGIAPLVFLAQYASSQHSVKLIHGAGTSSELYSLSPLPSGIQVTTVTEDGSGGNGKGLITDILPDFLEWTDQMYACGPSGMYKGMAKLLCRFKSPAPCASEELVPSETFTQDKAEEGYKLKKCQISLEVRMGCGVGACYGCSINTKKGLKKVCLDGPVFELDDILWEGVKI
ncbi:MAG: dihydroorotate dehydrogenase electron transfer subunit [Dehalococcoidia bacterium]|nr:dihydroorotate dehydrogenase electron transfer subunit [Dehalococcoidia bacterium]